MSTRISDTFATHALERVMPDTLPCITVVVQPAIIAGDPIRAADALKASLRLLPANPLDMPRFTYSNTEGYPHLQSVACSTSLPPDTLVIPSHNGFVGAVRVAYNEHLPLKFRADDVWLCVMGSIATHVNLNAERYRSAFVQHEGKQKLEVEVPLTSTADTDYISVVNAITALVAERTVTDIVPLMTPSFSTTDAVSTIVSRIMVVSALNAYLDICMRSACGIREVRLEGTEADWELLRTKVAAFRRVEKLGDDLSEWLDRLDGVLAKLHETACGRPDEAFWSHILSFQAKNHSGTENKYGGWLLTFFLYTSEGVLINHADNPVLGEHELPCTYRSVSVVWQRPLERIPLQLIAGSWNAAILQDGSVAPCMQWLVVEEKASK
jgi:hypothetical protein